MKYLRTSSLLKSELKAYADKKKGERVRRADLAGYLSKPVSTIHSWFQGESVPEDPSVIEKIATFLHPGNERVLRKQLIDAIQAHIEADKQLGGPLVGFRAGLLEYGAALDQELDFGPVLFARSLLTRFCTFSGVADPDFTLVQLNDILGSNPRQDYHVLAAQLTHPQRTHWSFVPLPTRIGVQAVGVTHDSSSNLASALCTGDGLKRKVVVVSMKDEIGDLFSDTLFKQLKTKPKRVHVTEFTPEKYRKTIVDVWRDNCDVILLVDELTAIQVTKKLVSSTQELRNAYIGFLLPFLPKDIAAASSEGLIPHIIPPRYSLAFAVPIGMESFFNEFRRSWEFFLYSDVEAIAGILLRLHDTMFDYTALFFASLKFPEIKYPRRAAWRFTRTMLGFKRKLTGSLEGLGPWEDILGYADYRIDKNKHRYKLEIQT